jgi:hypothetical protein
MSEQKATFNEYENVPVRRFELPQIAERVRSGGGDYEPHENEEQEEE